MENNFLTITAKSNLLKIICLLCLTLSSMVLTSPTGIAATVPQTKSPIWLTKSKNNKPVIHLYFFYAKNCPHCQKAKLYLRDLASEFKWLDVKLYDVSKNKNAARKYIFYARHLGEKTNYVPAFIFCKQMLVGYRNKKTTGKIIRNKLIQCHRSFDVMPIRPARTSFPILEKLNYKQLSLPVLTVIIATLDAFNPCAFFVLLFLLSLMAREGNRARLFMIGGVFILFSGIVYFIFISAWLNVFLLIGELRIVTLLAGLAALILALINIKDFFWFQRGVTLSIPEKPKNKLFQQLRHLIAATSLPMMLLATILLAISANMYELLCTAGLPMIYTRILTLHQLDTISYYAYIAFYCIIYVLPVLGIVILAALTLSHKKMSETMGRNLKLLSGLLMLFLAFGLLFFPTMFSQLWFVLLLVLMAVVIAGIIIKSFD